MQLTLSSIPFTQDRHVADSGRASSARRFPRPRKAATRVQSRLGPTAQSVGGDRPEGHAAGVRKIGALHCLINFHAAAPPAGRAPLARSRCRLRPRAAKPRHPLLVSSAPPASPSRVAPAPVSSLRAIDRVRTSSVMPRRPSNTTRPP